MTEVLLENNNDNYLGVNEVISFLSISRPFLYKLIKQGVYPPPIKLGKKSLWKKSVLIACTEQLAKNENTIQNKEKTEFVLPKNIIDGVEQGALL